ncbi:MAG: 5-formyltetrahydrofolate cyclo-ligase [Methanobacterium sp.]
MENKDVIRQRVWNSLENEKLSLPPKPPFGRIPNFKGSKAAANLLRTTEEWINSKVVFSSPDSAQQKVRENALKDKKILIMASPKLKNGYLIINPEDTINEEKRASSIKGAFKFGRSIQNFIEVDLMVEGSVAVDLNGNRLGKGGGYGDMEISHLFNLKAIHKGTPIVTTVHEEQIIDKVPFEDHDKKINMIVTPERVIRVK